LGDADDHAADDVDEHHEQSRDGVAAHEFGGAIHGAEERAFVPELFARPARILFIDQTCRKIGVDRHLLSRHGVPEACCDLMGKICLVDGLRRVNKTQRYSGKEPCVRLSSGLPHPSSVAISCDQSAPPVERRSCSGCPSGAPANWWMFLAY